MCLKIFNIPVGQVNIILIIKIYSHMEEVSGRLVTKSFEINNFLKSLSISTENFNKELSNASFSKIKWQNKEEKYFKY